MRQNVDLATFSCKNEISEKYAIYTFSREMFETFPVNVFLKRFTPAENRMNGRKTVSLCLSLPPYSFFAEFLMKTSRNISFP